MKSERKINCLKGGKGYALYNCILWNLNLSALVSCVCVFQKLDNITQYSFISGCIFYSILFYDIYHALIWTFTLGSTSH